MLDGITPGDERNTVWRAAFPVSWQCGGDDHSATTSDEVDCVVRLFDAANLVADAQNVLDGLSKDNLARVTAALRTRIHDGIYVQDISTARDYYYANNTLNYIPLGFADPAGIDLTRVVRVTAGCSRAGRGARTRRTRRAGATAVRITLPTPRTNAPQ